jgi:hypothetical protein
MATIKDNPLLKGVRGRIGPVVLRKWKDGRETLSNIPASRNRRRIPPGQKKQMTRFQMAAQYAKMMMARPEMKAWYSQGITPNKNAAFRVAHTDFLNSPKIDYIRARGYTGKAGDLITIKATDDFRVTEVKVIVYSSEGKVLERGNAVNVRLKPFMWKFRTTQMNPKVAGSMIKALAYDWPGNCCTEFLNFD